MALRARRVNQHAARASGFGATDARRAKIVQRNVEFAGYRACEAVKGHPPRRAQRPACG